MEAVALRMALIHQLVKRAVPTVNRIIATGGALVRSQVWTQMFADALGQPITLCIEPEASARGAAIMALRAMGIWRTFADYPPKFGATFEPDGERHKRFLFALERQRKLYASVKQWL